MPLESKTSIAMTTAIVALLTLLLSSGAVATERPLAVSPGEVDRSPEIAGACPTFSWAAVPAATGFELAVFDLAEPGRPEVVLRRRIAGAASAWSPARADCLTPGSRYAWTVRPLFGDRLEAAPAAVWSTPRRFHVAGHPTVEEVNAALEVLRRWQAGAGADPASQQVRPSVTVSREATTVEISGASAVRGENPATTGAQHGVTGQTSSTVGAGLVGINLSSGADLILDGAAQGQTDTLFSHAGIDRPATAVQTFNVQNSGAGTMTLQVDGATVWNASNDGTGSELDADRLDGFTSASFAEAVHLHLGQTWNGSAASGLTIANSAEGGNGLQASALAVTGTADGLYGTTQAPTGAGVHGIQMASWTAEQAGVFGEATGANSVGVKGRADQAFSIGVYGVTASTSGSAVFGQAMAGSGTSLGVKGTAESPDGWAGYFWHLNDGTALYAQGAGSTRNHATLRSKNSNASDGMAAYFDNASTYATAHLFNAGSGEVLYLENGGSDGDGTGGGDFIRAVNDLENDSQFRVLTSGEVRSDVGFYTLAADFAEMLPADEGLEPGEVLAIGPDGRLVRSHHRFEPQVVGVYSTRPGFVGGQPVEGVLAGHVPLAVVGIVPVRVSAENGAIAPGDLLVASDTPGHAMRGGPGTGNGTVIGKALAPHPSGKGVISMLVVLQ